MCTMSRTWRRGTLRQTFVSPQCVTHLLHSPQCTRAKASCMCAPRHDAPNFRITAVRDAHLALPAMYAREIKEAGALDAHPHARKGGQRCVSAL